MKNKTRRSSRDSDPKTPAPKMIFLMESQKSVSDLNQMEDPDTSQGTLLVTKDDIGASLQEALPKHLESNDSVGSLLVTKDVENPLESSRTMDYERTGEQEPVYNGQHPGLAETEAAFGEMTGELSGESENAMLGATTTELGETDLQKMAAGDASGHLGFSLGSTGSTMGAPPRIHPHGATDLKLSFGSMGSTKPDPNFIGTGRQHCNCTP